jgi:hypothetical protein
LACLLILIVCLAGCGSSRQETAATGASLSRQIIKLEQGASVDSVKEQLGAPEADTTSGPTEALSYGPWQLTFARHRLKLRSKVIVPTKGHSVTGARKLTKTILRLPIGTRIAAAEATLGVPEVVYEIYEGQAGPTKILRYASWELTFVHGALTQRAQ